MKKLNKVFLCYAGLFASNVGVITVMVGYEPGWAVTLGGSALLSWAVIDLAFPNE